MLSDNADNYLEINGYVKLSSCPCPANLHALLYAYIAALLPQQHPLSPIIYVPRTHVHHSLLYSPFLSRMEELFTNPQPFTDACVEAALSRNLTGFNVDFEPTVAGTYLAVFRSCRRVLFASWTR